MSKRILIVSEDSPRRRALSGKLWNDGFEVVSVPSDSDAEDVVHTRTPSAAIWVDESAGEEAQSLVEEW